MPCWIFFKSLGLLEIFYQPVSDLPVKGRVLLSVRFFFLHLNLLWWASYWVFSYLQSKVNFFNCSFQKKKKKKKRRHFRHLFAFIFSCCCFYSWHSAYSTSPNMTLHKIFILSKPCCERCPVLQNLHLASIHATISVGFSYHWVALQLYMKGHKVNENSIKTLLTFSEITKPHSQLNITFSIFVFKLTVPRTWDSRNSPIVEPIFQMKMLLQKELKAFFLKEIVWGFENCFCFFLFLFWTKSHSLEFMILSIFFPWNSWKNESQREKDLLKNVTWYPASFKTLIKIFLQTQT